MTSEPGERIVIRDVDWEFYEQLIDTIPERVHLRVNYDGEDIEILSTSLPHEGSKKLLGQFVGRVAEELDIPYKSGGQTTWKRPEVRRGLEADECYFFREEKLAMLAAARARKSRSLTEFPNPDLGLEVDDSPSKIDRPGIYSALRVDEVWRFAATDVFIDRLTADGSYEVVEESQFVPVKAAEIRRWVVEEDSDNESAWARRLRAWARAELASRLGH